MIIVKSLTKSFGTKEVLRDITFELLPGKVYGLVGVNGAGKTTLFRCLMGFENYEGSINCSELDLDNELGYLPTSPYIMNRITGREYIRLCLQARGINVSFEEMNIFDLPYHEYAHNYSTGMKKKLALTAILLQKYRCVILDEPFNGVDIQSNILITALIEKLRTQNKIVIISSHIFSTLKTCCDHIFHLEDGHISLVMNKVDFEKLEDKMKDFIIDDKIDKLDL